jgi:hypothetical protein
MKIGTGEELSKLLESAVADIDTMASRMPGRISYRCPADVSHRNQTCVQGSAKACSKVPSDNTNHCAFPSPSHYCNHSRVKGYCTCVKCFCGTYPFLCSSFLLTHTAVKASSRRHSSFFLQFRGWHKSPAAQEHAVTGGRSSRSQNSSAIILTSTQVTLRTYKSWGKVAMQHNSSVSM